MRKGDNKSTWLVGIYIGMMASSVVICFWLPLFFHLPPGQGYRHMIGLPFTLLATFPTLLYAVILTILSFFSFRYIKLKILAIFLNFMPTLLFVGMFILLLLRGNYPKP